MKRELRDVGASVRARLLERARKEHSDFQLLLTRYVLERLLYRLSSSGYRDQFVLKGALLLSLWVGERYRSTRDLDLLGYGDADPDALASIFREICSKEVIDDGVKFDVTSLNTEIIREDATYGGVRLSTTATVAGARVPVQIDIGFGDAITPAPIEIEYPALLAFPVARLRAYPLETVIAEKLETIVVLGMGNSRMKDYYDLFLMTRTFTLSRITLSEAIQRTFSRRGTPVPQNVPLGLSETFAIEWQSRWRAFLRRERMAAAPDDLRAVIGRIGNFIEPLLGDFGGNQTWSPDDGWSTSLPVTHCGALL